MTKSEIIKTAFRVWGRELYLTTSLTKLAAELGVSKPALYRHFPNKQTLLDTMRETFLEDYTAFIKPGYEAALRAGDRKEQLLIMMRTMVDFYARNMDSFVFSLTQVYGNPNLGNLREEMGSRGIYMEQFVIADGDLHLYPPLLQFIIATLTFWVGLFHKNRLEGKNQPGDFPGEDDIRNLIDSLEERILRGLGLSADITDTLAYEALEKRLPHELLDVMEDEGLLKAVAAVVAEAGPWNASMDMVARRSGLSKSGLYAHFKSRQDMISRLFQTEFERLADYAGAGSRCSAQPAERFYLTLLSIVDYLRSRPEILVTMDWIKTRRLNLDLEVPSRLYRIFSGPGLFPRYQDPDLSEELAQWILFLVVNLLIRQPGNMGAAGLPNDSVRRLFRFVCLGIGGFKL